MRRSSVVGPLILIAVGVFFLISNLRPDLSVWTLAAEFWPYLLIAWGLARLLEILFWFFRGTALPLRGLSGGEWAVAVLLCLAGSGVLFFQRHIGHFDPDRMRMRGMEFFGDPFDYNIAEQKLPSGKQPRILIENFYGNARIIGVDGEEVKVSGRKTIRSFRQEEADEVNRVTPLDLTTQGEQIVIRTNQQRASGEHKVHADLEITVPRGAELECTGRRGDFDVTDLQGNLTVNSTNAGVRLQNIGGSVRLDLSRSDIVRAFQVKGPVEVRGRGSDLELDGIQGQVTIHGTYSGDMLFRNLAKPLRFEGPQTKLQMEALPGELRVGRGYVNGQGLVGPVRVQGESKDVQLRGFTEGLDLEVDRGDVEVHAGLPVPRIDVRTRSGRVDLAIPENGKFELRAEVSRGELDNSFGSPFHVQEEGRGARMEGKTGDGAQVVVVCGRGTITLRKSFGNGEVPPLPPPRPPVPQIKKGPTAIRFEIPALLHQ